MAQRIDGKRAAEIMYGQGVISMSNLELWNKVQETDPKYTKAFSKGGGFKGTSINPTYNNKKATELFGPCGIGWGLDIIKESFQEGAPILINGNEICKEITHILQISFWYKLNGETGRIPSFGQTSYVGSNKNGIYTDEEAPKKSQTDAITKALSMLGFSSDVFMGMYDDVKYINDIKEHSAHKPPKEPVYDPMAETERYVHDIWSKPSKDKLALFWEEIDSRNNRGRIKAADINLYNKIITARDDKLDSFRDELNG